MIEIRRYQAENKSEPITKWLSDLRDKRMRAHMEVRFSRLAAGNFGDCKSLRDGVFELRIDKGPGYRVYYGMIGKTIVLLLCGGDKGNQDTDIQRAVDYLKDFKRRSA